MRLPRRRVLLPALAVLAVVTAAALAAFQPWRLFTSTTVREALPTVAAAPAASPAGSAAPSGSPGPSGAGAPSAAPPTATAPRTVAQGTFVSHEHRTSGSARLLRLPDGSHVVRLEGLSTSDGPDLHVWLSDQPVREGRAGWHAFDDGAHVDLGALKGNIGDQNYVVPAGTDVGRLTSVSVWCARFRVSFGAVALQPADQPAA
jgi:hypothetical protein